MRKKAEKGRVLSIFLTFLKFGCFTFGGGWSIVSQIQKEYVEDWRQLVESIMIDWNYDGVVMQPSVKDVPDKKYRKTR